MPLFTQLPLNDDQTKQISGETLTLSGETNFVGTLKSKNVEIDATATTGDTGKVLTLVGGKIQLEPVSGASSLGIYDGATPSTFTVGGVNAGTTLTGRSFTSILEEMLVVFQPPTFSLFNIAGISSLNEVGDPVSFVSGQTFIWSTTNSSNVSGNTLLIRDVTNPTVLGSGLADDGTEILDIGTVLNTSPITQKWRIEGFDLETNPFQRDYDVSSIYPYFYGIVSSSGASAGDNRPLSNQALINSGTKVVANSNGTINLNFNSSSDDYLWFAIPSTSTSKTVWFINAINNGSIGGSVSPGGNLFPNQDTVSIDSPSFLWSSINYKIYISNYQSEVSDPMELKNS